MTLQELSDAWNLLRNSALGRGTRPNVSEPLADEVAEAHSEFRRWLAQQGPLSGVSAELSGQPWIDRYRELAAAVRKEGQWAPELVRSPLERGSEVVETTVKSVIPAAGMAVLGVGALGLAYALLRGRR